MMENMLIFQDFMLSMKNCDLNTSESHFLIASNFKHHPIKIENMFDLKKLWNVMKLLKIKLLCT